MKSCYRIRLVIASAIVAFWALAAYADTIPCAFSRSLQWRVGAELAPGWVIGTNGFLRGDNQESKRISATISGDIRADFSFSPATREGMAYKGLYQGVGMGVHGFFPGKTMGSPVSAYVYQGAPVASFGKRLWLGYEWQFGAAFGWTYYDSQAPDNNAAVSTPVTAHMNVSFRLNYALSDHWQLAAGVGVTHYSNGNTHWPNAGVNSVAATLGVAYVINPQTSSVPVDASVIEEADRHEWIYDIAVFGAWRKRIVKVGDPELPKLCPGKFGVLGLQFAPAYRLNRWVTVGPALDLQWDESAGLAPYWLEGTEGDGIRFVRPPFGRQISAGISAHAELTMPIFSVNAGLGYDVVSPKGNRRFYQSLTLKAFLTKHIFLNVGYRLGRFKDPQNLMLGVGVRL